MHICVNIHIYMYIYRYTYTFVSMHTDVEGYIFIYIHISMHMCINICRCMAGAKMVNKNVKLNEAEAISLPMWFLSMTGVGGIRCGLGHKALCAWT